MDLGLKGKVVLISGASGGIGSAAAKMFDAEGAKQVLTYLNDERGKVEIEDLKKQLKGEYITFPANLLKEEDIDLLFQKADEKFGRIDILVPVAGAWSSERFVADRTLEEWNLTFSLNSTASFLLCRGFFRNLRKYKGDNASIVMVGSTAGVVGEAKHHDYAATKSAILYGLTKSLRDEIVYFAKYGRVNSISPGWTATPMAEEDLKNKDLVRRILSTIPLKKVGKSEDQAAAILFLASDVASGHISGEIIPVCGGMEGRLLYGELNPNNF